MLRFAGAIVFFGLSRTKNVSENLVSILNIDLASPTQSKLPTQLNVFGYYVFGYFIEISNMCVTIV